MRSDEKTGAAAVPMRGVGPIRVSGPGMEFEGMVPLATYESPLWPSVERGARVTARAGGIRAAVFDERMTRSVLVDAPGLDGALGLIEYVRGRRDELAGVAAGTSRFARLKDVHFEAVGHLVWIRFEFDTGDAAGHNMATRAADAMLAWILERRPECAYGSISGNYCCDKKASAVNGILGRGKRVVAEATVPRKLVERYLHSTPEKIAELPSRPFEAPQPPICGSMIVYCRPVSGWMPPMKVPAMEEKCPAGSFSGMCGARQRQTRS